MVASIRAIESARVETDILQTLHLNYVQTLEVAGDFSSINLVICRRLSQHPPTSHKMNGILTDQTLQSSSSTD